MRRFCYLWVIGWLWLPLMGNAAPVPAAQLSADQREWLARHKELRVGLVLQAPYAKFDQRLQQLSGANVELMKWLAQALDVELIWRNYQDLAQLEQAARNPQIVGLAVYLKNEKIWEKRSPHQARAILVAHPLSVSPATMLWSSKGYIDHFDLSEE